MKRKRRYLIGALIIVAAVSYLIYTGMREAVVYFVTPAELKADGAPRARKSLRMGGLVAPGSLQKDLENLTYRFVLTDGAESVPVYFRGVPPDLFAEGKGAVVEGELGADGIFQATTIMAKHAEEYSPPPSHAISRSFVPATEGKQP